jgi:hypothetical protein
MAPEKSTTPSSDSCESHDWARTGDSILVLPEGEKFRSMPPLIPLAEFVRRNQQLRRWFPHGVRRAEERWQAKSDCEFKL